MTLDSQTISVEPVPLSHVMGSVGSQIYLNARALMLGDPFRRSTFNIVAAGYSLGRSGEGNKRGRANCKDGARLVGFEVSNYLVGLARRAGKAFRAKGADYHVH